MLGTFPLGGGPLGESDSSGGVNASLVATLGGISLSATGTASQPGTITGTLIATLGALTASSAGTVLVSGSLSATLGAIALTADGTASQPGRAASLDATLGGILITADGVVTHFNFSESRTYKVPLCGYGEEHVPRFTKYASATLDYSIDFTDWLAEIGDEISSFTVDVGDGITNVHQQIDESTVTVWLRGGVPGFTYPVTVTVTTESQPVPRVEPVVIMIAVR